MNWWIDSSGRASPCVECRPKATSSSRIYPDSVSLLTTIGSSSVITNANMIFQYSMCLCALNAIFYLVNFSNRISLWWMRKEGRPIGSVAFQKTDNRVFDILSRLRYCSIAELAPLLDEDEVGWPPVKCGCPGVWASFDSEPGQKLYIAGLLL